MSEAVRDTARLHEKTVQAVANGEHERIPIRKRRKGNRSSKPVTVEIHALIRADLKARDVDIRKVEVLGPEEVIIHNKRVR